MSIQTAKIAISLPKATLEAIERRRRELGLDRSSAITEAVRLWLSEKEKQALEEKYIQGYKRNPERVKEIEPFYRAGLASFSQEPW